MPHSGYPPITPQARIAHELIDMDQRLTDLERTRPRLNIMDGPPGNTEAMIGTYHLDRIANRLYVRGTNRWYSTAVSRHSQFAAGEVEVPTDGTLVEFADMPPFDISPELDSLVVFYAEAEVYRPEGADLLRVRADAGSLDLAEVVSLDYDQIAQDTWCYYATGSVLGISKTMTVTRRLTDPFRVTHKASWWGVNTGLPWKLRNRRVTAISL